MNTKPIPAVLALIAGFVTCIMSFVQGIDVVVFAKRFVFVCLIFYDWYSNLYSDQHEF